MLANRPKTSARSMGRWVCLLEAAEASVCPLGKVLRVGRIGDGGLTGDDKPPEDKRKQYGQVGGDWLPRSHALADVLD